MGEGEDVGGGVLLPPLSVHFLDVGVAAEEDCHRHLLHLIELLPTVDRQVDDLRAVDLELPQEGLGEEEEEEGVMTSCWWHSTC